MFVCPFPADPKFWKAWIAFFFFFLIFNFAFLKKIVKIINFKMHVTVPKVNCVGTGLFVHPIHVSTRLFDVTYLNTENYMIYIVFLQHPDLKKKKKKKINIQTLPIFRPKGQTSLHFFRPYKDCTVGTQKHNLDWVPFTPISQKQNGGN